MYFPPEIWLKIFAYLRVDALRNVSLTCRDFQNIAQPYKFYRLQLLARRPGEDWERSRSCARLDFYAADAIAPLVRDLSVIDCSRKLTSSPIQVFDAYPRFIGVRRLCLTRIQFTQFHLQQMSTLPSLRSLVLQDCRHLPHTELLPLPCIQTFISIHLTQHHVTLNRAYHWLESLDANHLQFLEIPLTSGSCSFFLAIDNPNPFPALRTVKFDVDQETLPQVPMILSKTPAVRSLGVSQREHATQYHDGFLSSWSLPYLEVYHGPHELLRVRTTEPSFARFLRLHLESITKRGDSLDAFMGSLTSCHSDQLRSLTHLYISMVNSLEFESLAVLEEICPVLQDLRIHDCPGWNLFVNDVLLDDLDTVPLPSTLLSLSIEWTAEWDSSVPTPNLNAAKDGLVQRLPSLCRLWLCEGSRLAVLWSRTSSGEEQVTCNEEIYHEAYQQRAAVFKEDPASWWAESSSCFADVWEFY